MSDPVTHEIDLTPKRIAEMLRQQGFFDKCDPAEIVAAFYTRAAAAEARAEAAEAERDRLRGAMEAQDERERIAGEACGVPRYLHGCDWPDAVAEEIVALRARVPTEDEIVAIRFAVTSAPRSGARLLRALVARNTPKENPDGE